MRQENPDDTRECQSCNAKLTYEIKVRVSRLAITTISLAFCGLILPIPFFIALSTRRFSDSNAEWIGIVFFLSLIILVVSFILGIISLIQIETSDVNDDGLNELVALEGNYKTGRDGGGNRVSVWVWNGSGLFTDWRSEPSTFREIALEDINADGIADIVAW